MVTFIAFALLFGSYTYRNLFLIFQAISLQFQFTLG